VTGYAPHTPDDVAAMLDTIGVRSIDDLFAHVPDGLRARARIDLPAGLTEPELRRRLEGLAARNAGAVGAAAFLGAGAYPHWIPSLVDQILLRSEFATAYTPYQPEVSQGTLQATFEFQTFAAMLLGLEVANASMYDGASATAEAVLMARRVLPGRRTVWLSRGVHPHYRETLRTYVSACGTDVAVAEGQSLGLPMAYGGPGVGLFATRERYLRSMPGRIVGETVDATGRQGYVLTLATREQHIRRERATSNICTNQGLCALAATVYLSLLGRRGLRRLAETNYAAAHGVAARLETAGVRRVFAGPFFNEFVVHAPEAASRWEALARDGLVAGFPLERWYPEMRGSLLLCVTEVHTAEQIDRLVSGLAGCVRPTGSERT
jgi:glycine cleavage system pyridoxal-binding protein P